MNNLALLDFLGTCTIVIRTWYPYCRIRFYGYYDIPFFNRDFQINYVSSPSEHP